MVSLTDGTITIGENQTTIERWEVWFLTPYGLAITLEAAKKRCVDLDPDLVIVPVVVAVGNDQHEVVARV